MAAQDEPAAVDQLDRWIAEVGEQCIARLVEETSRCVAEGSIPVFTDKDAFLEHLRTTIARKPGDPQGAARTDEA